MVDDQVTPAPSPGGGIPDHVLAEARRILDREARRILDEQLGAAAKAERGES